VTRAVRVFLAIWAALSLLLCVAVLMLWVRSYWTADVWTRSTDKFSAGREITGTWRVHSVRGVLALNRLHSNAAVKFPVIYYDRAGRQKVINSLPDSFGSTSAWTEMDPAAVVINRKSLWQRLGFDAFGTATKSWSGSVQHRWGFLVPHWMVALIAGAQPCWLWWHARHQRKREQYRADHQLCRQCGYDLRESPERCPECGAAAAR
jgi:hypothetical protein